MKTSSALAYVGHNANGDREKDDFYPTPPNATQSLLDNQKFEGNIWECACGNGAMSKVMEESGYEVYSSDLIVVNRCSPTRTTNIWSSISPRFYSSKPSIHRRSDNRVACNKR